MVGLVGGGGLVLSYVKSCQNCNKIDRGAVSRKLLLWRNIYTYGKINNSGRVVTGTSDESLANEVCRV